MRRTALLEDNLESLHNELKPVKQHVIEVKAIGKFIALIGLLLSVITAIVKLI